MDTDPEAARQLIDAGQFDDILTAKQIENIGKTAKSLEEKQAKIRNKLSVAEIAKNEEAAQDLIADENIPISEKLLEINRLDLIGSISDGYATDARRFLKSKQEIDAVTNSDEMATIVTQLYDLNTIADFSSEDYLTGIQNIRRAILQKRANGKLGREDEQKLNNQIKTLTSAKVADATNIIAFSFGAANDLIEEQLPPEFRGIATRQLFYRTEGQDDSSSKKILFSKRIEELSASKFLSVIEGGTIFCSINKSRALGFSIEIPSFWNKSAIILSIY